jgi:hypothetical protein
MASANAGVMGSPKLPDPDHEMDLEGGQFSRTNAVELRAAFAKFAESKSNHVCVFCHGGLVSRDSGLETAQELLKGYTDAGTYPFFFIWNSGLFDILKELLDPHQHDPGFVKAANKAVTEVSQKIAAVLNLDHLKAAAKVRSRAAPLDLKSLAEYAQEFDTAWGKHPGAQLSVSPQELKTFGDLLLAVQPATRQQVLFRTKRVLGPGNPLGRIYQRINSGHDHGLYTTVIEELAIALGIDEAAGCIWRKMKSDIDAAFAPNPSTFGGTAFLENLDAAWTRNPNLKVTLIGHSAGAIYVQRFLEALDESFAANPERQVGVITLAAAVSFARMNQGLSVLKKRVSGLRLFGLSGKREGGYWEVPFIYNKSLLYIVSSLCEDDSEADKPLVGMRRYWSGARPYDQPDIQAVMSFVHNRTVWAPSSKLAKPGFRSNAKRHGGGEKKGGFPSETFTHQSVCYALKNGVRP